MSLDELIAYLEDKGPDMPVRYGFHKPHSYRGFYEQLAFEPYENTTIGEMLACARDALGETYEGWKGGDFTMKGYTDCWIAWEGSTSETPISKVLLDLLIFGEPVDWALDPWDAP